MRTPGIWLAFGLGTLGCQQRPPPEPELPVVHTPSPARVVPPERLTWTTHATEARGTLSQQPGSSPDSCILQFLPDGASTPSWSSTHCIAERDNLRFVASNGRRVVVFHLRPPRNGWAASPLAELTASGELHTTLRSPRVALTEANVRAQGEHVVWLAGVDGIAGSAPALAADGSGVEF